MPFLVATVQAQFNTLRQLSNQPVSSLQCTLDQQPLWQLCEIPRCLRSSHCTPSYSESSQLSSFTNQGDDSMGEVDIEILIQYGRGRSPVYYLPSKVKEVLNIDISDGSVLLSFSMEGGDSKKTLHIQWYNFKPSLALDMANADLILCHAGAGTLLEALSLTKPLGTEASESSLERKNIRPRVINAVINSKLMDNHQSELAEELERRNHVLVTRDVESWASFIGAHAFWNQVDGFNPKSFRGGFGLAKGETSDVRLSNFQRIVDRVMGI